MNEVLNRFASEAELDNIWMSAEVQDLKENRLGNRLCEIVSLALDTARKELYRDYSPKRQIYQNPQQGDAAADVDQDSVFL